MQASRARARLPQTVLIVIGLFLAKFPAPPQSPLRMELSASLLHLCLGLAKKFTFRMQHQ